MASLRNISYRLTRSSQIIFPTLRSRSFLPIVRSVAIPRSVGITANTLQTRSYGNEPRRTNNQFAEAGPELSPTERLYVGNLFFEVDEAELRKLAEPFGELTSANIIKDKAGFSKGFGFLSFANLDDAIKAKQALHLMSFAGRQIIANFVPPTNKRRLTHPTEPTATLFVANLPFNITDKELNDLFRPLNGIKDVRVAIDRRTGQPRGFAHADFNDVKSAVAAFKHLNGLEIGGRVMRCDYSHSGRNQAMSRFRETSQFKNSDENVDLAATGNASVVASESADVAASESVDVAAGENADAVASKNADAVASGKQ